jgi:hypothetical protein
MSQIVNVDLTNDSVYINSGPDNTDHSDKMHRDKGFSLCFNDRLSQFESFFSHEDIPFMFNVFGGFISVFNDDKYKYTLLGEDKERSITEL